MIQKITAAAVCGLLCISQVFALENAPQSKPKNVVEAFYYSTSEEYIKMAGGATAGVMIGVIRQQSTNICFNNILSISDSLIEYGLTVSYRKDWFDWTMWVLVDLGVLVFFGGKALYQCLANDPNFGWAAPALSEPNGNFIDYLTAPWTLDFVISLVSVATAVKAVIFDWNTIEPFYLAKKLTQSLTLSMLYCIQMIIYFAFGYWY